MRTNNLHCRVQLVYEYGRSKKLGVLRILMPRCIESHIKLQHWQVFDTRCKYYFSLQKACLPQIFVVTYSQLRSTFVSNQLLRGRVPNTVIPWEKLANTILWIKFYPVPGQWIMHFVFLNTYPLVSDLSSG